MKNWKKYVGIAGRWGRKPNRERVKEFVKKHGSLANSLLELADQIREADKHLERLETAIRESEADNDHEDALAQMSLVAEKAKLSALKMSRKLKMVAGSQEAAKLFYEELCAISVGYQMVHFDPTIRDTAAIKGKAGESALRLEKWNLKYLVTSGSCEDLRRFEEYLCENRSAEEIEKIEREFGFPLSALQHLARLYSWLEKHGSWDAPWTPKDQAAFEREYGSLPETLSGLADLIEKIAGLGQGRESMLEFAVLSLKARMCAKSLRQRLEEIEGTEGSRLFFRELVDALSFDDWVRPASAMSLLKHIARPIQLAQKLREMLRGRPPSNAGQEKSAREEDASHMPNIDDPIDQDEASKVQSDYGPLANDLKELANIIRRAGICARGITSAGGGAVPKAKIDEMNGIAQICLLSTRKLKDQLVRAAGEKGATALYNRMSAMLTECCRLARGTEGVPPKTEIGSAEDLAIEIEKLYELLQSTGEYAKALSAQSKNHYLWVFPAKTQAKLDGKVFDLSNRQTTFLEALIKIPGRWITGTKMPGIGIEGYKVKMSLPEEIRKFIESGGAKGYRLNLDA